VAVLYNSLLFTGVMPRTSPLLVPVAMLPRRNSTNATPGHVSPQSTSGFVSGRRPLSPVTTQQAVRKPTALAVETESPVSELSPQGLPPIPPPRPVPTPGNSGLRRRSTRRGTYETPRFPFEERVQPRPPGEPMVTISQISEPPPPTPTQLGQLAPGGGVGGFTPFPSPHYGPSRGYHNHNTADYTYRFDTTPSVRSDSGPPHYESADISGGIHANVWPTYNKISQEFDEKRLAKWNADLDVLLIFVSLVIRTCYWPRSG